MHCVYVNEEEIDILKNTNTIVVHNPESNMNNAVGMTPILPMYKKGIMLGLGTDGYTSSMVESVKVAHILPKLYYRDPRVGGDIAEVMLLKNNMKIASRFFNSPVGVIKPGAYADLLLLDYFPPTPVNADNFYSHLIFGIREDVIRDVFVNGELVVSNHKLTKLEEKEISRKSIEVVKKFWEKF